MNAQPGPVARPGERDSPDVALTAATTTATTTTPTDSGDGLRSPDRAIEALLLASEAALTVDQLQRLLAAVQPGIDRGSVRAGLGMLAERLRSGASEVVEVAGGWRLQVRAEFNGQVAQLWREKSPRFSRALLETLSLMVYRQPITRGEIEEVRGVAVSTNIVRTLLERGWIRELGHKEVPGRPTLYGTTSRLLDDLGLKSLNQLPELPDIQDTERLEAALRRLGVAPEPVAAVEHAPKSDGDTPDGHNEAMPQPDRRPQPGSGHETDTVVLPDDDAPVTREDDRDAAAAGWDGDGGIDHDGRRQSG